MKSPNRSIVLTRQSLTTAYYMFPIGNYTLNDQSIETLYETRPVPSDVDPKPSGLVFVNPYLKTVRYRHSAGPRPRDKLLRQNINGLYPAKLKRWIKRSKNLYIFVIKTGYEYILKSILFI